MSIDFENGLLVGLAIAYKKAARAVAFGGFLGVSVADAVHQRTFDLATSDAVSVLQPVDIRPPAADSVSLPLMTITDAVQVISSP
jgi:hypothetical protein